MLSLYVERGNKLRARGDWKSAIDSYETAFHSAVQSANVGWAIEAVLAISHSLRESGELSAARDHYELTVVLADLHRDFARGSRAYNGLGIIDQGIGEVEAALLWYSRSRHLGERAGDALCLGNVCQNLGTLASTRGASGEASEHYAEARRWFEKVGYRTGIAGVLNNLGMLHVDEGDLLAAQSCYQEASSICEDLKDMPTLSIIQVNRAELYIQLRAFEHARGCCDEAYEMASAIGDCRVKADVLKLYGVIYRELGKLHLAESHLLEAIRIASGSQNALTEAEARREYAHVLRLLDRNKEALEALDQAYALFQKLRAVHEQSEVTRAIARMQDDFLAIVAAWGQSIEAIDGYTRGHCQRVADFACRLAEKAGIAEKDMLWFRMGAFLHDVGKTELPAELLNKIGPLTAEERELVESHTVRGEQLLSHISFPWDVRAMVRSHHERWDGLGYPDGLKGYDIPLPARILRYADVFDALTTDRSYRTATSFNAAVSIMERDTGALDPHLFPLFRSIVAASAAELHGSEPRIAIR